MEDPHEQLAFRSQCPPIDEAARFEHAEDVVESAGKRLTAGRDASFEVRDFPFGAAELLGRPLKAALIGGLTAGTRSLRTARRVDGPVARARRTRSATSCWNARLPGANGTGSSMEPTTTGGSSKSASDSEVTSRWR